VETCEDIQSQTIEDNSRDSVKIISIDDLFLTLISKVLEPEIQVSHYQDDQPVNIF